MNLESLNNMDFVTNENKYWHEVVDELKREVQEIRKLKGNTVDEIHNMQDLKMRNANRRNELLDHIGELENNPRKSKSI